MCKELFFFKNEFLYHFVGVYDTASGAHDKYRRVIAICNNLAVIVSQCTNDQYHVRIKFLSQLHRCWSKGCSVTLQPGPGFAPEDLVDDTWEEDDVKNTMENDIDMKPEAETTEVEDVNVSLPREEELTEIEKDNNLHEIDYHEQISNDEEDGDDQDYVPVRTKYNRRASPKLAKSKRNRRSSPKSTPCKKWVVDASISRVQTSIARRKSRVTQKVISGTIPMLISI